MPPRKTVSPKRPETRLAKMMAEDKRMAEENELPDDWMVDAYVLRIQGLSIAAIARQLEVSRAAVEQAVERVGVYRQAFHLASQRHALSEYIDGLWEDLEVVSNGIREAGTDAYMLAQLLPQRLKIREKLADVMGVDVKPQVQKNRTDSQATFWAMWEQATRLANKTAPAVEPVITVEHSASDVEVAHGEGSESAASGGDPAS